MDARKALAIIMILTGLILAPFALAGAGHNERGFGHGSHGWDHDRDFDRSDYRDFDRGDVNYSGPLDEPGGGYSGPLDEAGGGYSGPLDESGSGYSGPLDD